MLRRPLPALALCVALAACGGDDAPSSRLSGLLLDGELAETSGLAASRAHPGTLWLVEDGGNPARLHAVSRRGRRIASYDIDGARDHLRTLCARHLDVAGIVTQPDERREVDRFIQKSFDELERIAGALGVLREVTPRWLDAIAATGEIVSSRLVTGALVSQGLASAWVDARRAIVTSDAHTAAAPLVILGNNPGFFDDVHAFLSKRKKWYLFPIAFVMVIFGLLIVLGGTAAAPFIYTLF